MFHFSYQLTTLLRLRTKDSQKLSGGEEVYDETNKKTTSTLSITAVRTDNAGEYSCSANFGGTTVTSNPATIFVIGNEELRLSYFLSSQNSEPVRDEIFTG